MSILRMAWRNVWRNRRRTLVTVAATTLAFTVMVLYSSLVQGYMQTMESNLLDLELGDVQIHAQEYRDDPSLYSSVDPSGASTMPKAAPRSSVGTSSRGMCW